MAKNVIKKWGIFVIKPDLTTFTGSLLQKWFRLLEWVTLISLIQIGIIKTHYYWVFMVLIDVTGFLFTFYIFSLVGKIASKYFDNKRSITICALVLAVLISIMLFMACFEIALKITEVSIFGKLMP